jgi:hypothetical protein
MVENFQLGFNWGFQHNDYCIKIVKQIIKFYNTIVIVLNNVKPNGTPLRSKKNIVACHVF